MKMPWFVRGDIDGFFGLFIDGVIALNQGFILVSMILAALLAFIIDRSFLKAGLWALTATALSAFGVIHAYDLTAAGVQNKFGWLAAPQFVAGYGLTALVLIGLHFHRRTRRHGLRTDQNPQGFHITALTRIRA